MLAIVPDAEAAAERERLSPGRAALARALQWRREAVAAVEAAVASHQRLEKLAKTDPGIAAKIASIKGEQAAAMEKWASEGAGGAPPEFAGTEDLEAELAASERKAEPARNAMPALAAKMQNGNASASAALETARGAAFAIVLQEALAHTATVRAHQEMAASALAVLEGALRMLSLMDLRHHIAGPEAQRLRHAILALEPLVPSDSLIAAEAARWSTYFEALLKTEDAQREETPR
jgi:hypothetical protein